jgi:S1-C subfamily serine protease
MNVALVEAIVNSHYRNGNTTTLGDLKMADVLGNLSQELAQLVKNTGPSIVRVEARRRMPATGIVWSADGLIVTANHVIEKNKDIKIGLENGDTVQADLIGRDPSTDIAVLKANASLQPAAWTKAEDIHVGNLVLAVGRPSEKVMATLGVVMAIEGEWKTREGGQFDHYLQTDVVMYPGFSGGALLGAGDQILGLNSSALGRGASISITQATVQRVVNDLVKHGKIRRGYLGVGIQPVSLPSAIAQSVGQETGVLLVGVESGSPADQAGMVLGDTLIHVDGQPVRSVDELMALMVGDRVGKSIKVKILRAGEVKEVSVTAVEKE